MTDYILTSDERNELIEEVAKLIFGGPIGLMTLIPQHHCIKILPDPVPENYAWSVVTYCEASAWMEDPALIVQLLSRWKHLEIFDKALKRIKNSKPPVFHMQSRVWDPILVRLNLPLLNRSITRRAVEGFSQILRNPNFDAVCRVLVVTGPEGAGKSFTMLYMQYIRQFQSNASFNGVYIDLKIQAVSRFGPLDLARLVLDQINPAWCSEGVVLPELEEEQPARWIMHLCRTIVDQIALANKVCVIILDGLDTRKGTNFVPAETQEMIANLIAIASTEIMPELNRGLMRLVLLGYEYTVRNYLNTVKIDRIKPVDRDDIRKYFQDYARFYGKTIDLQGIEDMVTAVMEDIPDDASRTRCLAEKALTIAFGIINS